MEAKEIGKALVSTAKETPSVVKKAVAFESKKPKDDLKRITREAIIGMDTETLQEEPVEEEDFLGLKDVQEELVSSWECALLY